MPEERKESRSLHNTYSKIVFHTLTGVKHKPDLIAQLVTDPGQRLADAGLPIAPEQFSDFNAFFRETAKPLLDTLLAGGEILESEDGCTWCQIGCWTIAAAIVGVGAAALAGLTVTSACVVALASFASVAATTALAFIAGLAAAAIFTASSVALAICEWTGACPC